MTRNSRQFWGITASVALALAASAGAQAPAPAQAPAAAVQTASTVDTGTINGAAYRIEVPANWNRGLVMYAHGYDRVGAPPANPDAPRARSGRRTTSSPMPPRA